MRREAHVDADNSLRREYLADLVAGATLERFTVGSNWQVYGFEKARGRCLLTEVHDEVPRCGYDLDHLRVRTERQEFPPRPGSPILGVMCCADDVKGSLHRVRGRRTSWPGDPASAWGEAATTAKPIVRPRPTPPSASIDDVAQKRDSFIRTRRWGEPIAGILCDVYGSPLTIPGDGDTTTNILIDVRIPDEQAARIVAAFTIWGRRRESHDAWGQEPNWIFYYTLTSAELFGEDAAGGYISRVCSAEPGEWALVSPSDSDEYPDAPYRAGDVIRIARPRHGARRQGARIRSSRW